jgi:hypothetical protein
MRQHPKCPLAGRSRHQSRARNARISVELNSPDLLTKFVTPAELRAAGKKRLVRHLQAAGGLPKVEDLADRILAVAAEQTIAVPAERMTARLIRELATEAMASRATRPRTGGVARTPP